MSVPKDGDPRARAPFGAACPTHALPLPLDRGSQLDALVEHGTG